MKSVDTNSPARQAWLRSIQGLPTEIPEGFTIIRQSDFEKSAAWRAVFVFAAIVIGITVFQPEQAQPPRSTYRVTT
ncbi:hypothetical protein LFL96_04825 [Paraburkholderia sp. D15]|uniref:hypothetical protein n=1 Tax=Paraburkholderia sp. D15 TaxID=2880218 RepID=UPI002479DBF0|nr:hypothetical protein [Paraburkholderia sp. D15]WGS50833.1 hypothetical protein LFL96_04825 [Paraburkholderia sp. D15]